MTTTTYGVKEKNLTLNHGENFKETMTNVPLLW